MTASQPSSVADRIAAWRAPIARRSVELMYADPFWERRFGARGRRFSDEDAVHHVDHLVLALRTGTAVPIERYARWLQTVLTTRGMCSRHLAQHFTRLGEVLREMDLRDVQAEGLLADARRALRYAAEPAAALFDAGPALALRALERLREAGARMVGGSETSPGSTHDLLETLASYLADAVALARADQLAGFVRWLGSPEQGQPTGYADALLGALDEALEEVADDAARQAGRAMLAEARTTLVAEAS